MTARKNASRVDNARLKEMYADGATFDEIAAEFGLKHSASVQFYVNRLRLPKRRDKAKTARRNARLFSDMVHGMTAKDAAEKYGLSLRTVFRIRADGNSKAKAKAKAGADGSAVTPGKVRFSFAPSAINAALAKMQSRGVSA